ncbi:HNH endonuclease [Agrobacterium rubi]|uniref:HNH endonuclease n=1 Tax=Agrobacterium rubi TaxID=28099 RepID=UPI001571737D|nr:HNH endonuclease [Agrobacterium rubi]NTF10609.1 HNH endonuclease [Agrobacterium rubi]NTF23003.1 HNH endonuclease [Agrobacterium rubi]NTF29934.1 HNH endonuclease [Agrobacterium rubi]
MLVLPFPKAKDTITLQQLLKKPSWKDCSVSWPDAYSEYEKHKGDPWQLTPAAFTVTQKQNQQALFKSRSGGGPIRRIRSTPNLKCCPMCGSPMTGTLDHYLPKEHYPEFSIFSKNLIPACPACNSSVKKEIFKGSTSPERFLHPYYDTVADKAIWKVSVTPPFSAPQFTPTVMQGFSASESILLQFHLNHILGEQFALAMETSFTVIPQRVRDIMDNASELDCASTELGLAKLLRDTVTAGSINCWDAALLRGVAEQVNAVSHVRAEANKLSITPIL